jgi:rod shape-determining protein MreD
MGDTQSRKLEEHLAHELLLIVGMAAVALVQATLVPAPLGFPFALVLVLVLCRILLSIEDGAPRHDINRAIRWAFYGGIALDLYGSTPLGSHVLALLLASIVVVIFVSNLRKGGMLLPLFAVFLGSLIYQIVLALIYHYTVAALDWRSYTLVIIVPSLLLTLIPTLPVFYVMRWRYLSNT